MTGDVVGWWCWASPSGGLTDLTGNWDVFLIDCERAWHQRSRRGGHFQRDLTFYWYL